MTYVGKGELSDDSRNALEIANGTILYLELNNYFLLSGIVLFNYGSCNCTNAI